MIRPKYLIMLIIVALVTARCNLNGPTGTVKPPAPTPLIIVDPDSGPVGTEFIIEVSGFEPDERIQLIIRHEELQEVLLETELQADGEGQAVFNYLTRVDQPPGMYSATAIGMEGDTFTRFEVLPPDEG
jgi:hypothetical protein